MDTMYKDHILQLWKHPENFKEIKDAKHMRGYNAGCGDDITMYLKIENSKVHDASFRGTACALCTASSSLVTDHIKGLGTQEILKLGSKDIMGLLGIEVLPTRLKCVLLPLETAQKIIKESV